MKKNNLLQMALLLGISIVLYSCFSDPGTNILINGAFVEINEATTSTGLDITKTYKKTVNGLPVKDSIRVNLVGALRSSPVTVNFVIDPTSTAVAGTHYNLVTNSAVTIAANSSFAFIYFNVLDDNINSTESWKIKFGLTGADGGIKLSTNYAAFTRTIKVN